MPDSTSRRMPRWVIPGGALLAGAGLGAGAMALWGPAESASPMAMGAEDARGGAQTVTVATQTLEEAVSASGTLSAVTSEAQAFEAAGTVTQVNVAAGDTVEAGDVIAEIDTLQLTASLRSAEAELAEAQARLSNLEDADDGSDSAEAQIASAQAQVAVAEESVEDAEAAMDDAQLVAQIGGLVTAQPYEVGDVVSGGSSGSDAGMGGTAQAATSTATDTGVTIVGQDEWTVSVSLGEADVALIEEGDQVTFSSEDVADPFFGIVSDIANLPTTTSGSATYAVELQVTGTVDGLYDGTSVDAEIVYLRQTDVLAIPTNAITTTDGVSTVTVVDDAGVEEEREVTVGEAVGTYTPVTEGLEEGEQLSVSVVASGDASGGETGEFQFPGGGELPEGFEPPTGGQMGGGMGMPPGGN